MRGVKASLGGGRVSAAGVTGTRTETRTGTRSVKRLSSLFAPINDDGSLSLAAVLSSMTAMLPFTEAAAPTGYPSPTLCDTLERTMQDVALFAIPYLSPDCNALTVGVRGGSRLSGLTHQHDVNTFDGMMREGASLLLREEVCIRALFSTHRCGSQGQVTSSAGVVWLAAACSLLSPDLTTLRGVLSMLITCVSYSTVHHTNGGLIPQTMVLVRSYRGGYIRNVIHGSGVPVLMLLDAVIRYWFIGHLTVGDVLVVTAMTALHGIKWPALVAASILLHVADSIIVNGSDANTVGTTLSAVRSCGTIDLRHTLLPLMERIVVEEAKQAVEVRDVT